MTNFHDMSASTSTLAFGNNLINYKQEKFKVEEKNSPIVAKNYDSIIRGSVDFKTPKFPQVDPRESIQRVKESSKDLKNSIACMFDENTEEDIPVEENNNINNNPNKTDNEQLIFSSPVQENITFVSPSKEKDINNSFNMTPSNQNSFTSENSFINNIMDEYYHQHNSVSPFKDSGVIKMGKYMNQYQDQNSHLLENLKDDYEYGYAGLISDLDNSLDSISHSTLNPKLENLLYSKEIQSHLQFLTDISNQAELPDQVPIVNQLKVLLKVSTKELQERVLKKHDSFVSAGMFRESDLV